MLKQLDMAILSLGQLKSPNFLSPERVFINGVLHMYQSNSVCTYIHSISLEVEFHFISIQLQM